MDNNLNNVSEPVSSDTEESFQPYNQVPQLPKMPASKLASVCFSILKAIGYVGVWLVIQTVIVGIFTFTVIGNNPTMTEKELNELIGSYSIELTIITNLISLGIFVLIFVLLRKSFLKRIKMSKPPKLSSGPSLLLGFSAQFTTLWVIGILMSVFPKDWVEDMNSNSEMISSANQTLVFIATVILAPLFEEIMCRGLILGTLRKSMPKWVAIVFSALIFGVIHVSPIQVIYATALGIMLGWIYTKTESILIPMLCHLSFNLTSMLLQFVNTESEIAAVILAVVMMISLPVTAICIAFFKLKKFTDTEEKEKIEILQYIPNIAPEYNAEALARLTKEIEGEENNENGD